MKKLTLLKMAAPVLCILVAGCVNPRTTNTGRSSIEQGLLSHAVERSVRAMVFGAYAGKKAVLDYSKLATQVDKEYLCGIFETHLANSGITIVEKADQAQIRIRLLCGVLATDYTELNIGTPALPIPVPYTSLNVCVPEISIFKRYSRTGTCRITAVIYDTKTDQLLTTHQGIQSRTFYNNWVILMLVPYVTRDIEISPTGDWTWVFWD
jgi:hypothetical protein